MNRLAALACAAPLLLAACASTPRPQGYVMTSAQTNTADLGGALTAPPCAISPSCAPKSRQFCSKP